MTAKVKHHIRNQTLSISVYLLEEQSCQISSRSDWKRRSFRLVKRSPQQEEEQEQERAAIRYQFLIQQNTIKEMNAVKVTCQD